MGGWEPGLIDDLYKKYIWTTRGENCPLCDAMAGRVYELDVYITSTVYPGFHHGCDCYLKEVPGDTPQSDLDIFGSSLNMRNDGWLEALFGNTENIWWSLNVTLTREIMEISQPGMTAGQALALLRAKNQTGIFTNYGGLFGGNSSGWSVWLSANPDLYKTFGEIWTSWFGTILKPKYPRPWLPSQTYHWPSPPSYFEWYPYY